MQIFCSVHFCSVHFCSVHLCCVLLWLTLLFLLFSYYLHPYFFICLFVYMFYSSILSFIHSFNSLISTCLMLLSSRCLFLTAAIENRRQASDDFVLLQESFTCHQELIDAKYNGTWIQKHYEIKNFILCECFFFLFLYLFKFFSVLWYYAVVYFFIYLFVYIFTFIPIDLFYHFIFHIEYYFVFCIWHFMWIFINFNW